MVIDGTEPGVQIQLFTRDVGIVDLTLIFDFFVAASRATKTSAFPVCRVFHRFSPMGSTLADAISAVNQPVFSRHFRMDTALEISAPGIILSIDKPAALLDNDVL
jgi:hypothetical protein